MFTERDKSSFGYWFAHLCAYNMVALNLGCWKFKYLFHDIEKPWLKLILRDYKKVQKIHRKHAKHHTTYKDINKIDWEAAVIDWESSRFTKPHGTLTAREEYERLINERYKDDTVMKHLLEMNVPPILEKLGL